MTVCALIFRSVHDVLKAEKIVLGKNLAVRLIPVPKQVDPDCGVALQISCEQRDEILFLLAELHHRLKGVYLVDGTRFSPLEDR
ncbi:MAG: DUF3343 domain-containing protein [Myxococcales bacterium]|nr:DUF3343 domain-containing protein [Myxococcales bacterium]